MRPVSICRPACWKIWRDSSLQEAREAAIFVTPKVNTKTKALIAQANFSGDNFIMTLLSQINDPADLRRLPVSKLQTVSDEIREYMIETLSKIGGHTGASLGPVELLVALHYSLDTPRDKLVIDIGHQAFV